MDAPLQIQKQTGTPPAPSANARQAIRDYYRETANDYSAWSPNLNMHFGYWRWGMNPFEREAMLESMSHAVIERLRLPKGSVRVADLGCGAGASARHLASAHSGAQIDAVTCVPEQITQGEGLNEQWAQGGRMPGGSIAFHCRDYTATGLPSGQYQAAYAIESDCHCPGAGKAALVNEAARLLPIGGRFVLADAMLHARKPLPAWINRLYRSLCRNWALAEVAQIDALREQLLRSGFVDIQIEDISWRVAPSALHIPWFATRFTLGALIKSRGRLAPWRWRHILASYQSLLIGLWRPAFGYFLVSATKA
jgi:MPBQ/MSBQ methyltransferase